MKRVGKPVFFIVSILIIAFSVLSIVGVSNTYGDKTTVYVKGGNDIRWGIDIRGGVDVTFTPPESVKNVTDENMKSAETIIKARLLSLNITDSEVYTDYNKHRIIVRFPWKEGETNFDPEAAIAELGATAELGFYEGTEKTQDKLIMTGADVETAEPMVDTTNNKPIVSLTLKPEGKKKFADATGKLYSSNGTISIWMDDDMISAPTVQAHITDGKATISGDFTSEEAKSLADKIQSGALPFKLETENFSTISPTLGMGAKDAMVLAGAIAFVLVCLFMIIMYRLPGAVACIALLGQLGGSIAAVSGFFPVFPSFTLTLPGIAGIILSIGMGVDANIITAERIKEEIRNGRSIDGSIDMGFERGFTAVFDGNITMLITAIVLMGAFGPPSSIFAKIFTPIFFMFGPSTAGAIYSFGYTLIVGVILNFIMGVFFTRLMLKSLSRFKCFRKPALYGGTK